MRIISRSRLRDFWQSRTDDRKQAERDLAAWYAVAAKGRWKNFGALRQTLGSTDKVGRCYVFDVGNNRFRLIARIFFETGTMYILKVMDHREYDRNRWPEERECHEPPPTKKPPVRRR